MPAISYTIAAGQTLEQVTTGVLAPVAVGTCEIRIDQTATAVTDAGVATGKRDLSKSEALQMVYTLTQYILRDTNIS